MKILVCGDVHWSTSSSIVKKRGLRYSVKLEYLIKSINYVEDLAMLKGVDKVIYLGDFFHKTTLNSEEITALNSIRWQKNIPHTFIVGNHEAADESLMFNSCNILSNLGFEVVSRCRSYNYENEHLSLLCIPYLTDKNRADIKEIKDSIVDYPDNTYIFSHNDIKGVYYGKHKTQTGYEVEDITKNCKRFINGHIHNGSFIDKDHKILNLGIVCGKDFNEDAKKYEHNVCILDTEKNDLQLVKNPFALNFYRMEINTKEDLDSFDMTVLSNSVVCITANENLVSECNDFCKNHKNIQGESDIVEWRVITKFDRLDEEADEEHQLDFNNMSATDKLIEFINMNKDLANLDIVKEELDKIIGGGN